MLDFLFFLYQISLNHRKIYSDINQNASSFLKLVKFYFEHSTRLLAYLKHKNDYVKLLVYYLIFVVVWLKVDSSSPSAEKAGAV